MNLTPIKTSHTMTGHPGRLRRFEIFIRNLPAPAEFCIVTLLWCAPLLVAGALQLPKFVWSGLWEVSNAALLQCQAVQLVAVGTVLWMGRIRGWSLRTLGFNLSWKTTAAGFLLAGLSAVLGVLWTLPIGLCLQHFHLLPQPQFTMPGLALPVVLSHALINPVFEEVLETGYFVHALGRFGMWPAVLASGLMRGLYHLWVGWYAPLILFPVGAVAALIYWRWRQLWPLVVAHALGNFFGLLNFVQLAS